jgi:hypothetical protein
MYFTAVLFKFRCPTWLDGTAVGYTLHLLEQRMFPLPGFFEHLFFSKVFTYGALFIESGLALMVFLKPLRTFFIPAGIALHLGMTYSFNIPHFSLTAIATYFAFIEPSLINRYTSRFTQLFGKHWILSSLVFKKHRLSEK